MIKTEFYREGPTAMLFSLMDCLSGHWGPYRGPSLAR